VATLAAIDRPPASVSGNRAAFFMAGVATSPGDVRTISAMIARLSTVVGVTHSLGTTPNSGSR
jgi:hypothetical protein